ncbi:hypothetical protein K4F52_003994 [Lecanicillium sp. MT-2017a]|nr:hypothetical protein K4F52_003994 [Lecanicillium sp. MT-2017a]
MVNRGRPSRDCLPCRRRKLRCDLRPEGCGQCSRAGLECSGYRSPEELRFRDQTVAVEQKAKEKAQSTQHHSKAIAHPNRKPSDAALISRHVQLRWDVFAKQDFFANFVFGLARSYDALGILYQTNSPPAHLAASVDAAALAFFALRQFQPSEAMSRLATERYVAALRLVNAALAVPSSALADDTLQSILLLDIYEKLAVRRHRSGARQMRHINGAVSLIRARGRGGLQAYVGRRLTQRLYTTLVITCAMSGQRIPDEMERLRLDLNEYYTVYEDPKWGVTSLNENIINFTCDVNAGIIVAREEILAQACAFYRQAKALQDSLPKHWRPVRTFAGDQPLGRQLTLAGSYDVYQTMYFAQVSNVIRTIHLNLLLMIECYTPTDDAASIATTRQSIEACVREVCDSLAQYMVRRSEDGALSLDLAAPMQQLGTYTILFPLYLAAQASLDTHLRGWVRSVLELAADVGGMAMARKTADTLRRGAKVPPWDVYTMLGSYAIAA